MLPQIAHSGRGIVMRNSGGRGGRGTTRSHYDAQWHWVVDGVRCVSQDMHRVGGARARGMERRALGVRGAPRGGGGLRGAVGRLGEQCGGSSRHHSVRKIHQSAVASELAVCLPPCVLCSSVFACPPLTPPKKNRNTHTHRPAVCLLPRAVALPATSNTTLVGSDPPRSCRPFLFLHRRFVSGCRTVFDVRCLCYPCVLFLCLSSAVALLCFCCLTL